MNADQYPGRKDNRKGFALGISETILKIIGLIIVALFIVTVFAFVGLKAAPYLASMRDPAARLVDGFLSWG